MSGLCAIARGARQESGAVLVFVALVLPAVVGVGGLVVDAGNWFAHKRHLQVQADAGALAGAGKFQEECVGGVSGAIVKEAARYSSVQYGGPGPGLNPQVARPVGTLHREINSKTFYNQGSPIDGSVVVGAPCAAGMIDVKLTETNLPWFLRLAQVPFINAHARVEIKQKSTSKGALPIGVPEVGPQKARAIFVKEATGAVVGETPLLRTGTSGGLAIWSNAGAPLSVTVNTADIGVRIVLSGTSSTTCGDPLVSCFGAGTNTAIVANTPGLSHIRGWLTTPAGTAAAPQLRNVQLLGGVAPAGICEDGYFTATSNCTVGIRATIDGVASTTAVFAKRASGANTKVPLTLSGGVWTAASGIPITAGEGPVTVNLYYGNGSGTLIGSAQRAFAGSESLSVSGPIKLLRLSEGVVSDTNSFQRCATCAHDLVVTLGLKPALVNAQPGDPFVSLKIAGGGSQNQGLDCDNNVPNFRDELANGCGPEYTVNTGTPCPGYAGEPGGQNTLWNNTPQPWKCVVINTGAVVGQATQGMNLRILGATNPSSCTKPNNWSSYPNLPAGDPRIVEVFLTPFGAFTGSGGTTVPVTGFASFYVTGWDGGGCQGSSAPPGKPDDPAGQGAIVGHFIKYIDTLNPGDPDALACDFSSLGSCVAVFTR